MLNEFRSAHITWDKATSRIYSTITANESDENGRKLVVQIINGGQVEDLTGATLHLYWITRDKLHDGLDVFKAVDLEKGEFELSYTTGMLSNKGVLNANLVLIDTVGRVVSERFKITVTEGIDNDAIQSENSFSSLTQALIDISNLEQNYAPRLNDLTAQLQQTEQDLNAQLAQKATKSELHTTNTTITNGLSAKVDKGGNEQVTWAMASQDFKAQITGGNTAVVGANSVNTTNVVDKAITSAKRTPLGGFGQVFFGTYAGCNIDTINKTVTFTPNFRISHGKTLRVFNTEVVVNLLVDTQLQYIVFNMTSQEFRAIQSGLEDSLNENDVILMTLSFDTPTDYTPRNIHATFEYTINGEEPTIKKIENSVDSVHLKDKAVTYNKRTKLGSMGHVFFSGQSYCNIDTTNKTVTFMPNFRITHGKSTIRAYTEPKTVTLLDDSPMQYVTYNMDTQTFRAVRSGLGEETFDEGDLVLMTLSFATSTDYTPVNIHATFEYRINGVDPVDKKIESAINELDNAINDKISALEITGKTTLTPILNDFNRLADAEMRQMTTDKDGTIYGYHTTSNQFLASSQDGGRTAIKGYLFDEGIVAVRVSGTHIVVATNRSETVGGKVYVGDKANGVTGPFELKVTMPVNVGVAGFGFDSYYDAEFGATVQNKNIVLFNEYGNKSLSAGATARNTYLSTDGGETFDIIFTAPEMDDVHMHAVVYDPYANRIWISYGDEPEVETGSIFFSEDMGVSWTRAYPLGDNIDEINTTIIVPTPDYVLFGTDKTPITGMFRWSRQKEMMEHIGGGDISKAMELQHVVRVQQVGEQPHYSRGFLKVSDQEYYIGFGSGSANPRTPYILATGDGGETVHTIYMDTIPPEAGGGFVGFSRPPCLGQNGEIVFNYTHPDGKGDLIFQKPEWV